MFVSRLCIFISVFACAGIAALGQNRPAAAADRTQLKLDTGEAEAVLAILDRRAAGTAVTDSDWQRLFATEPYVRLKEARG